MRSEREPLESYLRRPNRRRLAAVVEAYHRFVWQTALRVTRNEEDAQDISQEVFLKLLADPPAPGTVRSPRGYLACCVLGKATNLRRAIARREAREREGVRALRDDALPFEDRDALYGAIAELPPELRATIELRYLAGLPNRAIARTLEIAERTVEDRLERARQMLRRKLAPSAFGLLASLSSWDPLHGSTDSPPAALLERLLRVAELGAALSPGTLIATGGAGMAMRWTAGIAAALFLLLAGAAGMQITFRGSRDGNTVEPLPAVVPAVARGETASPPQSAARLAQNTAPAGPAPPEPRLARVAGVVWDDEGSPVAGANVRFVQSISEEEASDLREQGYTDAPAGEIRIDTESGPEGEFAFTGLLPVRGKVTAEHDTLFQCNFLLYGVRLRPGEEVHQNIVLCHGYRISGSILDRSGVPPPGAEVLIGRMAAHYTAAPEESQYRSVAAGADGRYDTANFLVVNRLVGGTDPLEVRAVAPGHAFALRRIAGVEFSRRSAEIDFALEAELPLVVLVLDPRGRPIEGAVVRPGTESSRSDDRGIPGLVAVTGSDGRARIEHLHAKRHWFRAEKDGYYPSAVMVVPGQPLEREIILQPHGPAVEGEIMFEDVYPRRVDERIELVLERLGEDGRFVNLWNVRHQIDRDALHYTWWPREPGRYRLRWADGLVAWRSDPFDYTGLAAVRADIHVYVRAPYVSGTVTRAGTGEPLEGAPVAARFIASGTESRSSWGGRYAIINGFRLPRPPGNAMGTVTGPDGRFLVVLPTEKFDFWDPRQDLVTLCAGSDELGWSNDVSFEFSSQTELQDVRLEVFRGGAIEGVAMVQDGQPSSSELVVATDCQGIVRWTLADREGRFRLDGLPPGNYWLAPLGQCASVPVGGGSGGAAESGDLPPPHELFERDVTVAEGETTRRDIDLEYDRLGRIEGSVSEALARPGIVSHGISYGLMVQGIPRRFSTLGGDAGIESGRFTLTNLIPGTYRISAISPSGAMVAEADIAITNGRVVNVLLAPPDGTLIVPLDGIDARAVGTVAVDRVERLVPSTEGRTASELWEGHRTVALREGLRIDGVPMGFVRVELVAAGYQAAQSQPVLVAGSVEVRAPAVALLPGRDIRLRLEAPDGLELPRTVRFVVTRGINGPRLAHQSRRLTSEPLWVLSAFAPGELHLQIDVPAPFRTARAAVILSPHDDADVTVRLEEDP